MKGGGIHKGGKLFWIQQLLTHLYTKSKNLSKQNSSKLSDNVHTLSKARYLTMSILCLKQDINLDLPFTEKFFIFH